MDVSVRVQHHPDRAALLPGLLARLGGLGDVRVVTDPGGDQPSSWRSHRACLADVGDATHVLVVQDDAIVGRSFAARTTAAIGRDPAVLLALFTPGFPVFAQPVANARREGRRSARLPLAGIVPLVAIVYPADAARDITAWAADQPDTIPDDTLVCRWARARRRSVRATVPSLVDHDDSQPSLFGKPHGRGHPHRAAAFFDG